nr:phosphatidate cytidylyltransferase [Microbacterium halophytorum]
MEHTREQFDQARERARDQVEHAREQFDQANERIKERTGRDLLLAIAVALVLGAAVLCSLLFLKGLFVVVALAGAGIGVFELVRAFQGGGRRVDLVPQLVAVPLILLPAYFLDEQVHWTSLFLAIALIIVWRLVAQMTEGDGRARGATGVLDDVVSGGFIALYVPFLASLALALLRHENGEWWILAFLIVVVVADTGAYASGLAFGKHKMAPRISPNKTWEGLAGAAVAALVAGALLAHFMLGLPWWSGLIIGAVILLTATIGDLGESMLKRDLGIKDMSDWIPGHGGVLDRLDSILLSAGAALGLFLALSPLSSL